MAKSNTASEIGSLNVEMAKVTQTLGLIKWIGAFAAGCMTLAATFIYSAGQTVARPEADVKNLQIATNQIADGLKTSRDSSVETLAEVKEQGARINESMLLVKRVAEAVERIASPRPQANELLPKQ